MFCEGDYIGLYVCHVVKDLVEMFVLVEGADSVYVTVVQPSGIWRFRYNCCFSNEGVVCGIGD